LGEAGHRQKNNIQLYLKVTLRYAT